VHESDFRNDRVVTVLSCRHTYEKVAKNTVMAKNPVTTSKL
jgi:hypothetical protein